MLDPPTDAIVIPVPRGTAVPFMVIEELISLEFSMEPANIALVTTPAPIIVDKVTPPDPLNPTAVAVTLPVNEKFLELNRVVEVAAFPEHVIATGTGFPPQFDPAGIVVATILATSCTIPVPLKETTLLVTSDGRPVAGSITGRPVAGSRPPREKFLDVARFVAVVAFVALPVRAPTNVVEVTEVKPAKVVELAPKEIEVEPIVTVELAKFALVIPAVPERLALINPEIVLEPAAIVLFVSVSALAKVANVPEVGSVTEVVALAVNVTANAPLVVKFPPRVIVLPLLATPVPPY